MSINERLGLARAELRRQGQDTRSESFNVTYGLSRDLVTEALLVLVVMVVCAIVHHNAHRNLIAAAIVAAGAVPRAAVNRRHRQARANPLALSRPLSLLAAADDPRAWLGYRHVVKRLCWPTRACRVL